MVEFALVLLPLLIVIGGVIQLGIAISNWHSLNLIADQSARAAAANRWPDCTDTMTVCVQNPACNAGNLAGRSLVNYIRCELDEAGAGSATIVVCRPAGDEVGSPVTVRITTRRSFLSVLDPNLVAWLGVNLRGEATMAMTRAPTKYPAVSTC
jgi:Flp pilus assembly protein TadG